MKRAVCLLAASLAVSHARAFTLPSNDPFYKAPGNVSDYTPGELIRTRAVDPDLSTLTGISRVDIAGFHQYLYRTTDSSGKPVAAVTSLLVPDKPDAKRLLVYNTAYDTANNDCSPSYQLQANSGNHSSEVLFMIAALNNGWYVLTSDYEGLEAQFVAGLQAGHAVLDAVRVALEEGPKVGLSPEARYVMWGYSGGSLASEWAAELQPSYAPELKFSGVALGGLVPNATDVMLTVNKGESAGLIFSTLHGLGKAYPELAERLDNVTFPKKKPEFEHIANGCYGDAAKRGKNKDVFSFFTEGPSFAYDPVFTAVMRDGGQMGLRAVPQMPLFIYVAKGDNVSPSVNTDRLVEKYCQAGATIEYQKDLIGDHGSEAVLGSAKAFAWVAARLEGKAVSNQGKCKNKRVFLTRFDIGTVLALGTEVIALLEGLV